MPEIGSAPVDTLVVDRYEGGELVGKGGVRFPIQYRRMVEAHGPGPERTDRATRSALLAAYARTHGFHALVNEEGLLLGTRPQLALDCCCISPKDALAVVGLYLRHTDRFITRRRAGPRASTYSMDRGGFYWGLARALLPAAWKWFSGCVQSWIATKDEQVLMLGQATITRVDRALRSRDRLWEQTQRAPSGNAFDEAMYCLEQVLLMLSGAFDAVARVATLVYKPQTSKGKDWEVKRASWREDGWRMALGTPAPLLANTMKLGTPERDALELVARLRNMVHGEGLEALRLAEGGRDAEFVVVPKQEEQALLDSLSRAGGAAAWGVVRHGIGRVLLDPALYVESLIPAATRSLNRLMEVTEVEKLPGVKEGDLPAGPPEDELFGADVRRRLLALAGL